MVKVKLERFLLGVAVTIGRLTLPIKGTGFFTPIVLFTAEDPWENNQVGISCIPVGSYVCTAVMYFGGDGPGGKKDYATAEITGVPGRSQIKFHIGNDPGDTEGCPLVGLDWYRGGVSNSRLGFAKFFKWFSEENGSRPFLLEVTEGRIQ